MAECLEKKKPQLNYSNPHMNKLDKFWQIVLLSGVTKLGFFGRNDRRYIWQAHNTLLEEKSLVPTVKHGDGGIMIWRWFDEAGTGKIVCINGKMDPERYQTILDKNI